MRPAARQEATSYVVSLHMCLRDMLIVRLMSHCDGDQECRASNTCCFCLAVLQV